MRKLRLLEPDRPQSLTDIADALQRGGVVCTRRMLDDASRDEPDLPLPPHLCIAGRTRLWDPLVVQGALLDLADWFDDAPARRSERQTATLAAQKAAQAEAMERRQREFAKQMKAVGERHDFFRQCEKDNAAEQEGRASKRGAGAIVPFSMGSK